MTLNSAVAHLLVAGASLLGAIEMAAAQAPAKDPVQLAREAADRALAAGDLAKALEHYERVRGKDASDRELLRSIAVARATQLRKDPDPRVRVDACAAILLTGADRSCIDELTKVANDGAADVGSRFAAAEALRAAKVVGSERIFEFVLGQAVDRSPATAADALGRLPSSISREPLKRIAADSTSADARYIAAMALSRMRGDDLVPLLRSVLNDKTAGAARLPALIGLARNGEKDAIKQLNDTLPYIKGRERIEAALALASMKDPRGGTILAEVANGDHELLRIDAAEAMFATQRKEAERILVDALASGNPWIKARAIQAAISLGIPQAAATRRAMLDGNATVAVASVRAAIADSVRPRQ